MNIKTVVKKRQLQEKMIGNLRSISPMTIISIIKFIITSVLKILKK